MLGIIAQALGAGTFPRGIHPSTWKEISEDLPIEVLPTPKSVRIPVLQHIGAPTKITVKPRAEVQLGDPLGETGGFVSAAAHASVTGQTARPGVTTLANGRHVPTVPIKAAEEQPLAGRELFEALLGGDWSLPDLAQMNPASIAEAAKNAGLVGMGGAAFPTHVKLLRNEKKPVHTLIVNGCECEPALTADYRLMLESPGSIVAGVRLAQHACGANRAVICLESDTPKAAAALRSAAAGTGVEIRELKTKYPQGGEKQLTVAVLGKAVPTGGLPLDIGAVVMNVGTVSALARMVLRQRPLTHRIVCVTGHGIKEPKNVLAPIGASVKDLLAFCGGLTSDAARVISGGPMMGFALGNPDTPITKGTSGVTVLTWDDVRQADETNCIRCGRCVDVCPLNLVPTKIALAARGGNGDLVKRYHGAACMECGCCAYTCPASIPLVQLIRTGKILAR